MNLSIHSQQTLRSRMRIRKRASKNMPKRVLSGPRLNKFAREVERGLFTTLPRRAEPKEKSPPGGIPQMVLQKTQVSFPRIPNELAMSGDATVSTDMPTQIRQIIEENTHRTQTRLTAGKGAIVGKRTQNTVFLKNSFPTGERRISQNRLGVIPVTRKHERDDRGVISKRGQPKERFRPFISNGIPHWTGRIILEV